MAYVYGFVKVYPDTTEEIIYIGKSDKDVEIRWSSHGHISDVSCYFNIDKLVYIEANPTDAELLETLFINFYQPKYNGAKKYNDVQTLFNMGEIFHKFPWKTWEKGSFINGRYVKNEIKDTMLEKSFPVVIVSDMFDEISTNIVLLCTPTMHKCTISKAIENTLQNEHKSIFQGNSHRIKITINWEGVKII